jgi:hypothetical protein
MQNSSKYNDNKQLFLGPQVTQYDGHMVMTNVTQPTKRKLINLDTGFRDEYSLTASTAAAGTSTCTLTLPERINNVKSVLVRNLELPVTFYNISDTMGNHQIDLRIISTDARVTITVPNGEYTETTLFAAIDAEILGLSNPVFRNLSFHFQPTTHKTTIYNSDVTESIAVHMGGRRGLGWLLGFRTREVIVPADTFVVTSEAVVDIVTNHYFYLLVDEFVGGGAPNSFLASRTSSLLQKNILARIAINRSTFGFGSWITANNYNGYLLSDRRTYAGKVDIQRLQLRLVNDMGQPVDLNGAEFSLCVEVEYE